MVKASLTGQRLVVLFFLGLVAFNFPILGLFERSATVLGIPVLFAFAYGVWAVLILAMAWATRHRDETAATPSKPRL